MNQPDNPVLAEASPLSACLRSMPNRIRTVLIDDSAFVRQALGRMLAMIPEVVVVGTGVNGREAIELVREQRPDVVIMDVNMPEMDGIEALRHIMTEMPTPVLLVSTVTQPGAEATLQALEAGAVDFIDKGSVGTAMNIYDLAPVLREKVLATAGAGSRTATDDDWAEPAAALSAALSGSYEVIAIGASTGGPRALSALVPQLPADLPAGVLIAQHMPAGFTQTLAERLDRRAPLHVMEATDGQRVGRGEVLIAPGHTHMTLERDHDGLRVRISSLPGRLLHQPSVDLLFESVADTVGARAIGVVLTGMGDDGTRGLERLQASGARTLVESASSAVIYGMPRAARAFAEQALPLLQIAPALVALCSGRLVAAEETP